MLLQQMTEYGHEQVSVMRDPETGYRGIIAIHDTTLGPALGGTRLWHYADETDALIDVLRLSRGMTYKAAMANLKLGGGKSVILEPDGPWDRAGVFRSHGRHVESLGGRYITAEDVATSPEDMEYVREETAHVKGLKSGFGDPSPVTAYGVFRGIQACAQFKYGAPSLAGKTVAVQGVGHVGYHVCRFLHEDGARLIVTDLDAAKIQAVVNDFGAQAVEHDAIFGVEAHVLAPCALGSVINDTTLPQLRVEIVAGGANNQLAEDRHGDGLAERGIIYAPDYVANGGGLMNVYAEIAGISRDEAHDKAGEIYDTVLHVLEIARDEGIPSYKAADRLAERRIAEARASAGVG